MMENKLFINNEYSLQLFEKYNQNLARAIKKRHIESRRIVTVVKAN